MTCRALALGALALAAALPAPAWAQEDGVFYDDDSSAGKEYAIPHEEAREGSGGGGPSGGGPDGSGTAEAPGDAGGSGAGDAGGASGDGSDRALFGEGISRTEDGQTAGDDPTGTAPTRAADADGGGFGWAIGIALGVLALGLLLALASRRWPLLSLEGLRRAR